MRMIIISRILPLFCVLVIGPLFPAPGAGFQLHSHSPALRPIERVIGHFNVLPTPTQKRFLPYCSTSVLSAFATTPTIDADAAAQSEPQFQSTTRSTPWRTLLKLCQPDIPYYVAAFLFLAFAAFGDALLPALQGQALNTALGLKTRSHTTLRSALFRLLGVGVGTSIFTGIRGYLFWICGSRLVARLRATLFEALLAQPQAFHDEQGPGELSSRLATDCVKLGDVLSLNVNVALRQVIQSIAGIAIVTRLNGKLAGLVVLGVVMRAIFASYYSKLTRKISQAQQDALAESSGVAEQCLSLIKVVRSHGNEENEEGRYRDKVHKLRGLQNYQGKIYGFSRVFNGGLNSVLNVAILTLGAAFVSTGILPKEALTSFVLYVSFISDASADVVDQWSRIQEALGAATEVFEYLEPRPIDLKAATKASLASQTPGSLPENEGVDNDGKDVLFLDNVSFAYPSQPEKNVLKSVSLTIRSGQRVAIVGGSGSGKSTIFALALRFYTPGSGRVLLDGVDLAVTPNSELRQRVAWVQQEPPLFPNATIHENIAYGLPGCTNEAVKAAAREANAEDFILATPDGFDTRIGSAGASLSGGQKQRVALARALVRNPDLLLLDEATSALDPESQMLVEAAIARAATHCTVLFTTHKVSQAQSADRIVVIAHGKIVEDGTHDELLQLDGAYANLVRVGDGVSEEEASVLVDRAVGVETELEE